MKSVDKALALLLLAIAMVVVDYFWGRSINLATAPILYRKEWMLAALVAGLLNPALTGWKQNAILAVGILASFFSWHEMLNLPVNMVPIFDPDWHWNGSWWDFLPPAFSVLEFCAGLAISERIYTPRIAGVGSIEA